MSNEFDFIVIGAGSAGAAVAGRLSEKGDRNVLLLEAGGSDRSLYIQMPAASYLRAIANPRFDWRYKAQPDPTRNGRRDYMPRGKVLGGSSSINGMIYLRGQREDFDDWAAMGNEGWDYDSVLPYFIRAENNENGASRYHGAKGPLHVSNLRCKHEISDAFIQAGIGEGLPWREDMNVPPQEGIGTLQATQVNGRRCSSARAYLWPAAGRKNLDIRIHAHVSRILVSEGRARGVSYIRAGREETATARRAVVLCGGAIASPQILHLSGIGPGEQLSGMNIPVVRDLPGVGENFHDHPGTNHTVWVNRATYNTQNTLMNALWFGAQWLFFGTGPGTTPDTHVLGFLRSRPELERCDIQYHFTPVGYDLSEDGPVLFEKPAVTGLSNMHRPYSRGRVQLATADAQDQPAIHPNLLADERDVDALVAGAKFLRRIFNAAPMRKFVTEEFRPGTAVQTDDEWRAYVRESASGIYHPAGSCKMGNDPMAVVDHRLRVHGIDRLYIADASIMPVVVSANLNANCIMIGERCADFVTQDTAG